MSSRHVGKRRTILVGFPALFFAPALLAPSSATAEQNHKSIWSRLSLRLSGGEAYISAKDFNDQMYYANYYYGKYYVQFCDVTGEYLPIHWTPNFRADIIFDLTERLGLGLGIEFLDKTQESSFVITYLGYYGIPLIPMRSFPALRSRRFRSLWESATILRINGQSALKRLRGWFFAPGPSGWITARPRHPIVRTLKRRGKEELGAWDFRGESRWGSRSAPVFPASLRSSDAWLNSAIPGVRP